MCSFLNSKESLEVLQPSPSPPLSIFLLAFCSLFLTCQNKSQLHTTADICVALKTYELNRNNVLFPNRFYGQAIPLSNLQVVSFIIPVSFPLPLGRCLVFLFFSAPPWCSIKQRRGSSLKLFRFWWPPIRPSPPPFLIRFLLLFSTRVAHDDVESAEFFE